MEVTTLSSKGQFVLPKTIRDAHDWGVGSRFAVEKVEEGVLLRPLKPFPAAQLAEVFGCLKYKGRRKTIAQMHGAIRKEARRRHGRGRY